MAAGTMTAFADGERMDGIMTSLKVHGIPKHEMPSRYESDEEDMSEADLPSTDDHVYSPIDSDIGAVDYDHDRRSPSNSPNSDFAFRLPSPTPGPETPKSPVRDGKRGSCLTLMAPKTPKHENSEKQVRRSYGPYRDSPPSHKTRFFSSMLLDAEARPLRQSICSEILSSDDELGHETHFLIATSVVYHVPDSKPNIISVGPASSPSTTPPVPEQQKKRPAPLNLAPARQASANSSRTPGKVKNRLARLMSSSKQEKRRGSYFMQLPNTSNSSILETPSFVMPNWDAAEGNWRQSGPEFEQSPETRFPERDSWFSHRMSNTSSRYSSQSQKSHASFSQAKEEKPTPALTRSGGFRKRMASHGDILSTESPSPQPPFSSFPSSSVMAEQKKRFVYSLTPPSDRSLTPHSNSGARTSSSNQMYPTSGQTPPPSSTSREKAYSIKSVASNSSKLSLSPFDTTSFKSLAQRYVPTPTREYSSAQRRPSGSLLSPGPRSDSRFRESRHNSEISPGVSRTHTLALGEERSFGTWKEEVHEKPKRSSPSKHKHSSSKSVKWFQDKGGNMSQAGTKALNGLGSMIKRK
ncbi:hypothetical protein D8B26_006280 [Coccidioides posadasii str. Silveira]|uniref:Uncharacterized protein n=3 Tax=Coccidioides posadasii TaxID=199306 RepID=E9CSN1_COCPS|nr:hypothetical protein CPC735_029660 [Coccidioides posadasii C735 delta SOWgp]EER27630.1 hypothetical protein CPC735_029660 [Coccidioides posadasii C735 delta SOWgp]EFW22691.1 conserved hypothetical protein [Coccidioides posadasii str. Silveira]KMM67511.1 hypothetical protein CPAG_03845 [Coccidioides posadasii RMSCC 3488]QVM11634.1 hypothetical protein D8B26_006280 [Coccidioides posadasii str. Silveira]|eukprot:XP_003069775.1 hypothetical protein CPC735_029660 [Coccidioides posadasii C735 delta SOWgp]